MNDMGRLDKERQDELEPKRIEFAKNKLSDLGYEIVGESDSCIQFIYNGNKISFFPYSGWYTGKGIGSGRGINKLMKQLK